MCKFIPFALAILAVSPSWVFSQTQSHPVHNPPSPPQQFVQGTAIPQTQNGNQSSPRSMTSEDQSRFQQIQNSNNSSFEGYTNGNQQGNQTKATFVTQDFPPIQRVGYVQDGDPAVPDILAGPRKSNEENKPAINPQQTNPAQIHSQFNPKIDQTNDPNQRPRVVPEFQGGQVPKTDDTPTLESFGNQIPNNQYRNGNEHRIDNASIQTMLRASGPWLEATATGPQSIGIGKAANYEVRIVNRGNVDCAGVLVGINFPSWVDLSNAQISNGSKEITDGRQEARVIWQIENIPSNSAQTMSLQLTPRHSEIFDVSVEWTLIPVKASSQIHVTEPKLDIAVAGPADVQYGQKVGYNVTVRNPGTGEAENVTIHLPEELGGEAKNLGTLAAGEESNFKIELIPRTAGPLAMTTKVSADGGLEKTDTQNIIVRRANLDLKIDGPTRKYAGEMAVYNVQISNNGDAIANDVVMVMTIPNGTKYVSGIQGAQNVQGAGIQWSVGTIPPGTQRQFKVVYELEQSGQIKFEAGAQGSNDLIAANSATTSVDSVADLVLSVIDPKGPLPTAQDVVYKINIKNRGTKTASNVQLQMYFSKGLEPTSADGVKHQIQAGEVAFDPIVSISPGQEKTLMVTARATQQGIHTFRAKLICQEAESHDITEGTTRFYSTERGNNSATDNQFSGNNVGEQSTVNPPAGSLTPPVNVPETGMLPPTSINSGGGFKANR